MSDRQCTNKRRRELLKVIGSSVAIIPLSALQGCSQANESTGETKQSTTADGRQDDNHTEAAHASEDQKNAMADTSELPRVTESSPDAVSLGYRHDATQVDREKFPQYEAGQICENCSVYAQNDKSNWSTCPIFPNELVRVDGWCALYAPIT